MRVLLAALPVAVLIRSAGAQNTGGVACRGQIIRAITVDAQAPTVTGLRRVPVVGNVVRETHIVTRDEVVRGFLLLRTGDRCSELRRAESERILRAQPFLADADIAVLPDNRGGVTLDVRTIDEASLILSGSVSGSAPAVRSAKIGSGNLGGLGVATSVTWGYHPVLEDRLELRAQDYLFAGRPYVLSLALVRDPLGRDDHAELVLPFRTDLQHFAWRATVGDLRGHAQFAPRDSGWLTLGFGREYGELGGIGRLGPPGKLTLFGLSLSSERTWPDTVAERLDSTGLWPDTAAGFAGRFAPQRAARVNALIGVRGIRFIRVRGFDALRATQDVPLGLQVGTMVGRAIPAFGANSNDLFVASDVYMAAGSASDVLRLQFQGEGRRDRGGQWDGLVASGRLALYSHTSVSHTHIVSLEWSGTSRILIPYALTLGPPDGGMRGFRSAEAVGGHRGIARVDEQFYLGSPSSFGDAGIALFADAGQLWAGDLPYGQTTKPQGSAGFSLLLAVPMRSKRMWRLDFAAPLTQIPGTGKWEIRLSHSDRTTFFWREPTDLTGARARGVPSSVYNWP